ncbi:MAG: M36 family metallopeptidase, partial [Bacteroidota bacterium]
LFSLVEHLSTQSRHDIAVAHLRNQGSQLGQLPADLSELHCTDSTYSPRAHLHHFYFLQARNGVTVANTNSNVNISDRGKVWSAFNRARPDLDAQINTETPVLGRGIGIENALAELGWNAPEDLETVKNEAAGDYEFKMLGRNQNGSALLARLMYWPISEEELRLSWSVYVKDGRRHEAWQLYVDAVTGEILHRKSMLLKCFEHLHQAPVPEAGDCAMEDLSMLAEAPLPAAPPPPPATNSFTTYRVFAAPIHSPEYGPRSLEVSPHHWLYSPYGWHDTNGAPGPEFTDTEGNNTQVVELSSMTWSPDGGPSLDFDFPYNPNQPLHQSDAFLLTHTFYWMNYLHDVTAVHGFDSPNGNHQVNTYGAGGLGGDGLLAAVDTSYGITNAYYALAADGVQASMVMGSFQTIATTRINVTSPVAIAGPLNVIRDLLSPNAPLAPVPVSIVEADDGSANPAFGCAPLQNAAAINGNIALMDFGPCGMPTQISNAENAGAVACILCDTTGGTAYWMGPTPGGNIPVLRMAKWDCDKLRPYLSGTITATMQTAQFNPLRSSALESPIIAHEFGHGVGSRLGGGPSQNCVEEGQEGFADWLGLILAIQPGDQGTDPRPIGAYAMGHTMDANGIRPSPYSTDMNVYPWTYGHIYNHPAADVYHDAGSVWGNMLWEITWALIDYQGFDPDWYAGSGGNNIAMELVFESQKIHPCNASFIESRNAVLQADSVLFNGMYSCLLWQAFAKRGMGFSATAAYLDAFDMPSTCALSADTWAFSAKAEEGEVVLDWRCGGAEGSGGYAVERKMEDELDFHEIGYVSPSNGTRYDFIDADVVPGGTYYYRIGRADHDGQIEYSEVEIVTLAEALELKAYPVPTANRLEVEWKGSEEAPVRLRVWDAVGRLFIQENIHAGQDGATLELSTWPSGTYILEVQRKALRQRIKIMLE